MNIRFELRCLNKTYLSGKKEKLLLFRDLNYRIYNGINNALIGRSGCGKSTLARILVQLENYDSGEIFYKGRKIDAVDTKEFRRQNQIMFQNPLLAVNPCFKIRNIITEPMVIEKIDRQTITSRLAQLCEILKLPKSLLDSFPEQVSGGELQRVVLARALVLGPEFLILDEPFSSLDEIQANRMIRFFRSAIEKFDLTILYISHRLDRVAYFADHICELKAGQVWPV